MTLKQKFIKEYAHLLYETQGAWSYNYIPKSACKEIAKYEAEKMSENDMQEYLET